MNSKTLLSTALAVTFSLGSAATLANPESGSDLRWFEVEVILFKQDATHSGDPEQFALPVQPIPLQRHYDPLSDLYQTDNNVLGNLLPPCQESEYGWLPVLPRFSNDVFSSDIEAAVISLDSPIPRWCRDSIQDALVSEWYLPEVDIVPPQSPRRTAESVINGPGGDMHATRTPFLMPSGSHELTSLRQRLSAQAGKETLLHVAWRQPVFTRTRGRKIRLFGGYDFTPDFDYLGYEIDLDGATLTDVTAADGTRDRMMNIDTMLARVNSGAFEYSPADPRANWLPERPVRSADNIPADSWELDGLLHIYLVGNYLHIDGEFNRREVISLPIQPDSFEEQVERALNDESGEASFLRSYYFKQLRRVISHETHYFDHPHMGMIVQIRRTSLSHRR